MRRFYLTSLLHTVHTVPSLARVGFTCLWKLATRKMLALAFSATSGCMRFDAMPAMPPGTSGSPSTYAVAKTKWSDGVNAARYAVRSRNLSWVLTGTDGEQMVTAAEIREKYAGIMFGDLSEIRVDPQPSASTPGFTAAAASDLVSEDWTFKP